MAVRHCSNVQKGGWHFALQKKPDWITLRVKSGPHSATTTHCLCGQANSGDHCHSSSMY